MIDGDGNTHLLEANGDPTIKVYIYFFVKKKWIDKKKKEYAGTGLTPILWDSMLELVEAIHIKPSSLDILSVRKRFAYKVKSNKKKIFFKK